MSTNEPAIFNLTSPAILAHPNLFTARAIGPKGKESGTPKFTASFILDADHPDLAAMKSLAAKVAKAKWPGRDFKELKFPFTSGDKLADKRKAQGKEDGEFQRGKVVIKAKSKYEPRLAAIIPGRGVVDFEGDGRKANEKLFFFGAECLAQFNFSAYDGAGDNPDGVTAYLNLVLVTGKGKKLSGGGVSAAEAFKGYVGTASDFDPSGSDIGLDEEIPF